MDFGKEISYVKHKYEIMKSQLPLGTSFSDLPLSQKTLKGLLDSGFTISTKIQRDSIQHALLGKDVVAVAETGCGKTLAFLIPVLERLFVNKWTRSDGLACLIISPTREISYQLFETLRSIGKYHDFSAGLIIGGKNLRFERRRMDQCNILICTPGRLLQHMDENPLFNAINMELLVLDEADRCLDKSFEQCLNAILKNLPVTRQTLLFSATSPADLLARLNLRNPIYVGTNCQQSKEAITVPKLLRQNYVVVELEMKITVLWSFIKNHSKQKVLVFLSSCKQVKYVNEIFSKLRPGITLLALYGTLSQDRRISIYNDFIKRRYGVLLATDLASRGLDFPDVNWVVQLDCPEDVSQYIHRGGRTARNKSHGENLLVLIPQELEMIKELKAHAMELHKIAIDSKKCYSPIERIRNLCARSPELKLCAQRAFVAYVKSVFLMKNKNVFDLKRLHLDEFAESLGLLCPPRIRFLERYSKRKCSNNLQEVEHPEDCFLTLKHGDHDDFNTSEKCWDEKTESNKNIKTMTKVSQAKKIIKKKVKVNRLSHFNGEGKYVTQYLENNENGNGLDIKYSKNFMIQQDQYDKIRFHAIVKSEHRKVKKSQKKCDVKFYTQETSNQLSASSLPNSNVNIPFNTIPEQKKKVVVETKLAEDVASHLLSFT